MITILAARSHTFTADDLAPRDVARWKALRAPLAGRQQARRAQRRFRHDPTAYLTDLELSLLKPSLPA